MKINVKVTIVTGNLMIMEATVNINEIAKAADVSIATVSRVINGKKDVSQETRDKVMKVMKQMNYKPKYTTTSVIDYIGVFVSAGDIASPYSSILLNGIADVVFDRQLSIALMSSSKVPKESIEFVNFCKQRCISGGIFLASTLDETYIKELGRQFPLVVVGNNLESEYVGSVRSDNFTGSYKAVKYLIACGHKKIMLVMANFHYIDHIERFEGAKKALDEANMELNPFNIMNSDKLSDADLSYSLDFSIKNSAPDAIFVGGDHEAIRVLRVLKDKGIKVPDDISIVGYDNIPIAASSNPPLTTVNQPISKIGSEAAKMLLDMIASKKNKPKNILLQENDLIIRESVISRNNINI